MGRLRANFARLGDPLQGLHNSEEPLYKSLMRQMVITPSRRESCAMLFLGIIRYEQYYDELVAYGDFPPFGALRHHLSPVGSVSLDSQSPKGSLRIQFPCHPAVSVGRQKESAFMGRLGALIRPTCTSYAGCAQWTIKLRIAFHSYVALK